MFAGHRGLGSLCLWGIVRGYSNVNRSFVRCCGGSRRRCCYLIIRVVPSNAIAVFVVSFL